MEVNVFHAYICMYVCRSIVICSLNDLNDFDVTRYYICIIRSFIGNIAVGSFGF